MKGKLAALVAIPAVSLAPLAAHATSVLDTATKAAVTTGMTDMKDTALDLLSTGWPFIIGIMAIMFAPKFLKRLASKA